MTAWIMGSIMAVAAVLLIHIDKNHVGIISPTINLQSYNKHSGYGLLKATKHDYISI